MARQEGNLREASQLLTQASELHPENTELLRELAELQVSQGLIKPGITTYRRLLNQTPDDAFIWARVAELELQVKNRSAAYEAIGHALHYDPEQVDALVMLAQWQEENATPEETLQTYHQILRANPEHRVARLQIARLQIKMERPERATPILREFCQCPYQEPVQTAEARWLLGFAYGQQKRWPDSAVSLAQAMQLQPSKSADDWYRLAYAQWQAGSQTQALNSLRLALQLSPEHSHSKVLTAALGGIPTVLPANYQTAPIGLVGHSIQVPAPPGW